jgi:hypothetical protein
MSMTVIYLRDREKIPIYKDEMKDGFSYFTTEIYASRKDVDVDGKNRDDIIKKKEELILKDKEKTSK